MLYKQSLMLGAIFIIASEFVLVSMGAVIKTAAEGLSNEMIVFFRNLFGLLVLVPLLLKRGLVNLKTQVLHIHLLRGLAGLAAMYCFFYAIAHINLADAMLLKLSIPLFIPIVAFVWLRERIERVTQLALLIGFFGVVMILKPGVHMQWAILIALAGSLFASVAKTTIRRLSSSEPVFRIVFYFAVIGMLVSAIPLIWAWQTPNAYQWLLLLSLGPLATLGQLLMTRGYATAPASNVGLFSFSAVLFGAAYGWVFWGEIWDIISIMGAILIAISGAMVLRSEPDEIEKIVDGQELAMPVVVESPRAR